MITFKHQQIILRVVLVVFVIGIATVFAMSMESSNMPPRPLDPFENLSAESLKEEQNRWRERIAAVGAKSAYQEFKQTYEGQNGGEQHSRAHIFGDLLFQAEGIDGVAVCDSSFSFGCYHSFFGRAIVENGLDVIHDLDEACIDAYGPRGLGCQHGLGHGVLSYVGSENLGDALAECGTLNWQEPIGGCTSGVFMEFNFLTMEDPSGVQHRPVGAESLQYPCTVVDDRFTEACYFEQPQWWLSVSTSSNSYQDVGQWCAMVSDRLDQEACYRGAGNIIAGNSVFDIARIKEWCGLMPDGESNTLCLQGAAWLTSAEPGYKDTWKNICADLAGRDLEICLSGENFI